MRTTAACVRVPTPRHATEPPSRASHADRALCHRRTLLRAPTLRKRRVRLRPDYANRPRGMREKAAPPATDGPPAIVSAPRLAPTEAARRWAALLQQIFEVDPLACPTCRGPMRIIAFITQASVIDQILAHLRARAARESRTWPRSPHRRGPRRPATTRGPLAWAAVPPERLLGPRRHRPPTVTAVPRPSRRANETEGTPPPAGRCSRGRRSRRILDRPQSKFRRFRNSCGRHAGFRDRGRARRDGNRSRAGNARGCDSHTRAA